MKTLIVRKGDTLTTIAERVYGNLGHWITLYMENMGLIIDDPRNKACLRRFGGIPPRWIFPGQVLAIPAAPTMPLSRFPDGY
jgi:nucleoid-associated protein YgaU